MQLISYVIVSFEGEYFCVVQKSFYDKKKEEEIV